MPRTTHGSIHWELICASPAGGDTCLASSCQLAEPECRCLQADPSALGGHGAALRRHGGQRRVERWAPGGAPAFAAHDAATAPAAVSRQGLRRRAGRARWICRFSRRPLHAATQCRRTLCPGPPQLCGSAIKRRWAGWRQRDSGHPSACAAVRQGSQPSWHPYAPGCHPPATVSVRPILRTGRCRQRTASPAAKRPAHTPNHQRQRLAASCGKLSSVPTGPAGQTSLAAATPAAPQRPTLAAAGPPAASAVPAAA